MNSTEQALHDEFLATTEDHQLTVLHFDGLYRHLRFRRPGTVTNGFDLITWPGHLVVSGDLGHGDWSFSSQADMFAFFTSDSGGPLSGINPLYWVTKLPQAHQRAAKRYSADALRQAAHDLICEWSVDESTQEDAIAAFDESLPDDELEQREYVATFEYLDAHGIEHRFHDTWEWAITEWDTQFLMACYAIVWGIAQWRDRQRATAEAIVSASVLQPHAVDDGHSSVGLVQSKPSEFK